MRRRALLLALALGGCDSQVQEPPVQPQSNAICTDYSQVPIARPQDPPPAISGGTLLALADGKTAVAADPDRDRVYFVDLPTQSVRATVQLQAGDEPGRLIVDRDNRVHVALRRGGAVVALDAQTGKQLSRRDVCPAPRGLAYEPMRDLVHVACAGGELVSLPASGGRIVRKLLLDHDLRDVIVDGTTLVVSRFRSAELLQLDSAGNTILRMKPPALVGAPLRDGSTFSPAVAWRTISAGHGMYAMLHQRGFDGVIDTQHFAQTSAVTGPTPSEPSDLAIDTPVPPQGGPINGGGGDNGGYGSGGPPGSGQDCNAVVHAALSLIGPQSPTQAVPSSALSNSIVLPVDFAPAGDGRVALIAAATTQQPAANVFVFAPGTIGNPGAPCLDPDPNNSFAVTEPIAVAWSGPWLLVQSREPATLTAFNMTNPPDFSPGAPQNFVVTLAADSRLDPGHEIFHSNVNGIACASCHPEGGDDSRTWLFDFGPRRSPALRGGILGSEPFHWSGDLPTMMHLVNEVMTNRMGAPPQSCDQIGALASWVDTLPPMKRAAPDAALASRGRELFFDPQVGCATCHTPPLYTNGSIVAVRGEAAFNVPRLIGVSDHPPFLHDGCAPTLRDRFGPCGGGDFHGHTSQLSSDDVDALVAFLETL